jgi:hypothetical protein
MDEHRRGAPDLLREIITSLQRMVTEEKGLVDCVVVAAPPFGSPYVCVGHESLVGGDSKPALVIWLLLDPTDVDSKQTTFVKKAALLVGQNDEVERLEMIFAQLYQLK